MKLTHLVVLLALTAVYLCLECAFNARLLDAAGTGVDLQTLHRMENFGRALSGFAVALIVLQVGLARRAKRDNPESQAGPSWRWIAIACVLSAVVTFAGLKVAVEHIVSAQDAEFRKRAVTLALLREAIRSGQAEIAGLSSGEDLVSTPEGRAFLALFPMLIGWFPELGDRVESAKEAVVARRIRAQIPVDTYYAAYREAIETAYDGWKRYSAWRRVDVATEVEKQHAAAWGEYVVSLGQQGWTPSSTPPTARRGILRKLSKKGLKLPSSWHPADEFEFRRAVQARVESEVARMGDGSVRVGGERIPAGLSWSSFLSHRGVQSDLRQRLGLPSGIAILPKYEARQFEVGPYAAMLKEASRIQLQGMNAPATAFQDGGELAEQGIEATQAVIAPGLALGFSLLGAVTHACKLLYLVLRSTIAAAATVRGRAVSRTADRVCLGSLLASAAACLLTLGVLENPITESDTYRFIERFAAESAWVDDGSFRAVGLRLFTIRVIAVGQSFTYPINEKIRMDVLDGFGFGYES